MLFRAIVRSLSIIRRRIPRRASVDEHPPAAGEVSITRDSFSNKQSARKDTHRSTPANSAADSEHSVPITETLPSPKLEQLKQAGNLASETATSPCASAKSSIHGREAAEGISCLAVESHSAPTPPPLLSTPVLIVHPLANNELRIMQRKIWVKRPGASATLVAVHEEDLVDTVRDVILQKYANSLGRTIDSPDITLKIVSREPNNQNLPLERTLGPEEPIGQTLDLYYAGGQKIEEALIIDVPQRKTPKASPLPGNHHQNLAHPYYLEDIRPGDGARDYFPPMPLRSPHLTQHMPPQPNGLHIPHSIGVLTSGQIPALPSPSGHSTRKHGRPKYVRQHTSSPTIMHTHQPSTIDPKQPQINGIAAPAQPLPTPPAQNDHRPSMTPPNRTASPHPGRQKKKKTQVSQNAKSINGDPPPPSKPASAGLLDGNVPPINVLLVEDNVINLKLLEQMMRRLKVRFKTAMNGREAVTTWRTGGFHLVLMDIQLPIMNGLDATKEIRRLESINGIGLGVFGGASTEAVRSGSCTIEEEDKLTDRSLFKSPVIIVALTASSLQSDRHEALAAGCNDFLTKPVNYPWMERKVTEWGCMQALIDFDGWRKWKADAAAKAGSLTEEQRKTRDRQDKEKQKAALKAMFTRPPPSTQNATDSKKDGTTATNGVKPASTTTSNSGATSSSSSSSSSAQKTQKLSRTGSGSNTVKQLETHEEEDE